MDEPFCMDKQQRYVWARFHLSAYNICAATRSHAAMIVYKVLRPRSWGQTPRQPPPPLQLERSISHMISVRFTSRWILLCREESRLAIAPVAGLLPLDPVGNAVKGLHEAVSRVLDHISDLEKSATRLLTRRWSSTNPLPSTLSTTRCRVALM